MYKVSVQSDNSIEFNRAKSGMNRDRRERSGRGEERSEKRNSRSGRGERKMKRKEGENTGWLVACSVGRLA